MLQSIQIAGTVFWLYSFFDAASGVVLILCMYACTKKFALFCPHALKSKRPTLTAIAELTAIGVPFFLLFRLLNPAFGRWFTNGYANYYGNLAAWLLALTLIPALLRISPLRTFDLLTPGLPLSLFVAKLGCFFNGCCYGIELRGSWYLNQMTHRYEFPVQLLEAVVALGLFFFLRWYRKRAAFPGGVFPVYLVSYSVTRFFTEFLRDDLPDVVGGLDAYQVISLVCAILGMLLLYNAWTAGKQLQAHYDRILQEIK